MGVKKVQVKLEDLVKRFGETVALDGVDLEVEKGELLGIVSPSGCGKTTILRSIAGLEMPDKGTIYVDDKLVFSKERAVFVPPHLRGVGMVFQNYALWPHLNVFQNIAYPLKAKHVKRNEVRREVEDVLSLVHLEWAGNRFPHELSAGESQRVALARALVMDPRVLLLDEPLSGLDAKLREEMKFEIKRIQSETGGTIIYVTHDQSEAMSIADRVAVMNDGKLIQVGTSREIYERPETEFVASFIGKTNLIPCRVEKVNGRKTILLTNEVRIETPELEDAPLGETTLYVRPEDIRLSHDEKGVEGEIKSIVYLGNIVYYVLSVGSTDFWVQTGPEEVFEVGEKAYFNIRRATKINYIGGMN